MRNILTKLLIGLIAFSIIYLLASFVELTLDFTQWSEELRLSISVYSGFSILVLIIYLGDFKEK